MKKISNLRRSSLQQRSKSFISKWHRGAVLALLICLIGILPIHSFAQPLANGKSKFLGCSIGSTIYSNFADYWNQVTPGNASKWGSVEYSQDQYNRTQLDNIYDYAMDNDFLYKHHTLV